MRPDGDNSRRMITDEAISASALYGTPDAIAAGLTALREAGAEYVLLNSAGGLPSLRRFAHEIRPAFTGAPTLQPA
jgi:alkanesulfonate monooxygenase SsuD/methylene tetrahydromethanopterin reductase-like flavin-dependent oxidoreductase (luciferase family)